LRYPATFHGRVSSAAATPVSQITPPITFRAWVNFYTQNLQFEVAIFETVYNTFLGRPTLTKFMAIPHYAYLVLKMLGLHGVISIRGDIKRAYNYDKKSFETVDILTMSVEL
jgi:hypothetical protein